MRCHKKNRELEVQQNKYFRFTGKIYKQTNGAPMGSPLSSVIAHLYIRYLEEGALNNAKLKSSLWKRYYDATFYKMRTIVKAIETQENQNKGKSPNSKAENRSSTLLLFIKNVSVKIGQIYRKQNNRSSYKRHTIFSSLLPKAKERYFCEYKAYIASHGVTANNNT